MVVLPRATHWYRSIRAPLTELRMRLRELVQNRIRCGYRKLRVLLLREGWKLGKKLVYRLYREEGLGLRARPKRRRTVCEHTRQKPRATGPNEVWSLHFVADQLKADQIPEIRSMIATSDSKVSYCDAISIQK